MSDYTTTAVFKEEPKPVLTVEHNGGSGSIEISWGTFTSEQLYSAGETFQQEFEPGTDISINYDPNSGWEASQDDIDFTLYDDRYESCVFSEVSTEPETHTLSVQYADGEGEVKIEVDYEFVAMLRDKGESYVGEHDEGDNVHIYYYPDDGWQVEGNPPESFYIYQDRTVTASFEEGEDTSQKHIFLAHNSGNGTIRVYADGNLMHTLRNAGETYAADHPHGTRMTINYYPSNGWELDGSPPTEFDLTEDYSIAVDFVET